MWILHFTPMDQIHYRKGRSQEMNTEMCNLLLSFSVGLQNLLCTTHFKWSIRPPFLKEKNLPASLDKKILYQRICFNNIYWQACTKTGKPDWKLAREHAFWPHQIVLDLLKNHGVYSSNFIINQEMHYSTQFGAWNTFFISVLMSFKKDLLFHFSTRYITCPRHFNSLKM